MYYLRRSIQIGGSASNGGSGITSDEVDARIDSALAGYDSDNSSNSVISGFDVNSETGFTKTFSPVNDFQLGSSLPADRIGLFTTGTTVKDGIYTLQFQITGTIDDADSAFFLYAGSFAQSGWDGRPYVSHPFLLGDYSTVAGVFTIFIRQIGTNCRVFYPAKGILPMHYSVPPETADSVGDLGLFGDFKLPTNNDVSLFGFNASGATQHISVDQFNLQFEALS